MFNFSKLWLLWVFVFSTGAFPFNTKVDLLANNKEPSSSSISSYAKELSLDQFSEEEREGIVFSFKSGVSNYFDFLGAPASTGGGVDERAIELRKLCDLNFFNSILAELRRNDYSIAREDVSDYLVVLRSDNAIDDILYDILALLNEQFDGIREASLKDSDPWFLGRYERDDIILNIDLQNIFSRFAPWERGGDSCLYVSYHNLMRRINNSLDEDSGGSFTVKKMNFEALNRGIISRKAFWQLEYLRKNEDYYRAPVPLGRYLDTILQVKDTMIPKNYESELGRVEAEDDFVSEKLSRFSDLTRRKLLYRKYTPRQIVMLAQVLEKASRRMGTDPDVESSIPVIIQEFSFLDAQGVRQNYVERMPLDAQSQYNYARRRMRMDIIDLQNMGTFRGVRVEYTDLIAAALETGYISHEDIAYVVAYDDLWNPELDPWRRLKNFCYSFGRASIFYLPAPWNIIGTIGLTAIQSFLSDNTNIGEYNDNPATFIE